jgi:hypothetical protein
VVELLGKKRILVVDVPGDATAETAAHLLNEACERGYYVMAIHPGDNGGARAFFNLRRADFAERSHTNVDGKDAAARAYIKAHVTDTVNALLSGLADLGITRKRTWVTNVRLEVRPPGGGSTHTAE